ncbi:acyl-CoA dehydrogenase [Pseudonocardia kunmingensis]|uniref:Alkylation response protein AidB-like acyl-CoA dehydrogenase n=1 Tax=Pseudonocardia kunmingensis TaxID=630975 RepID=A0A543DPL3_9PSEU|nr:acyl-CoA dehydrogenase [Pseudonocardia kunmingensis]TQM11233.1 alkylation response protein AidB-like acyl-CoA dehydrogenase [Pseudonocardia kunmingensis]
MALALTDEHRELADVVRAFLTDHQARAVSRGFLDADETLPEYWGAVAELGWLGLHVPVEYGGQGFGVPELAVVLAEFGRAVAPGPLLSTTCASAIIAATGGDELRSKCLPALADGSQTGAVGLGGGLTRGADGTVSGDAGAVLGAHLPDALLVLTVGEDLVAVAADAPGVQVTALPGIDPTRRFAAVHLDGVTVPDERVLPGALGVATRTVRALAAVEASGIAHACVEMATEYATVRVQFGRTIGTFQAVKHHAANMLVGAELATAVAWDAARAVGTGLDEQAALAAAVGVTSAVEAAVRNAETNIQLHGGIGFTWEHDAHLYLRRAAGLSALVAPAAAFEDEIVTLTRAGVRRSYAIDLPPEAETHRAEARAFVERFATLPESERRHALVDSGYLVPHWPLPWGRAAGAIEQLVIEAEFAGVDLPVLGIGGWVTLTLAQHGTPEQVERWVRPSLLGDLNWCQLFSEPGAGSDAAAVSTRGVRVDGGWIVNGQKVWTSGAQHCNRGFATVRTDPDARKHRGITMMAIDMTAPGVEVRPLREITGESLFNEVFFDDVFVPDADVVGGVHQGWAVARATLGNERVTIGGGSRQGLSASDLFDLQARCAPGDDALAREIARLVAEEQAMRLLNLRQAVRAVVGGPPGPEGNITKLLSAEHAQRVSELGRRIAARAIVAAGETDYLFAYLFDRCLTIAGGTSEIGRNVIAERLLGLPRDPLVA